MIILYVPTHRHVQLCVWNHWHETNSCLTRRSAAMSSAFFSMPLGQSLFRPTPDYPSPKRMESNSMPRKMSLTSENLVGIKDGCTLIVLTKSKYLNLMKWFLDAGSIAQLVFSWWTNNQHTCVLKVSIEIIERYELDKYGEMPRVFTAHDARILCLYWERDYKVRQRIHIDSLNSFKNVSWEEAWEWLDHWSFSFHSFFINKKQNTVDGSELR